MKGHLSSVWGERILHLGDGDRSVLLMDPVSTTELEARPGEKFREKEDKVPCGPGLMIQRARSLCGRLGEPRLWCWKTSLGRAPSLHLWEAQLSSPSFAHASQRRSTWEASHCDALSVLGFVNVRCGGEHFLPALQVRAAP